MNNPKNIGFKFLKIAYKSYKPYFYMVVVQALINTAVALFDVYSVSYIIKNIETHNYDKSMIAVLVVAVVNLILRLFMKLVNKTIEVASRKSQEAIDHAVSNKLMNIPFEYLENPEFLDIKEKAKFAIENQNAILNTLQGFASMIKQIITLIGLLAILITFDLWLLLILLVSVVLSLLIVAISAKTQYKFFQNLLPINRMFGYYLDTLLLPKNAKDYRFSNIGELMAEKLNGYSEGVKKFFKKIIFRLGVHGALEKVVKYLEMGFVYSYIAIKSIVKSLSISQVSLYITSSITFSTALSSLIQFVIEYKQRLEYLAPFVQMMEVEEIDHEGESPIESIDEIEFKNVSFHYPCNTEMVLKDLSFKINKGEKISIVGLNGAGKTTLIKLLCRLYNPVEGEILINGKNINSYHYSEYTKLISAIFQDFKIFAYTISENIALEKSNYEALECANSVGLKEKIASLPKGIDSSYTKIYDEDGVEFSGGELQKIAIARALYKKSSLVILDEPTSALDPLAEAEIYQNFNDLVKDKTAIYISHRMSSSIFCDKILIIDNGTVADFAPHNELMKKETSLYYQLFMSQAKNYDSGQS